MFTISIQILIQMLKQLLKAQHTARTGTAIIIQTSTPVNLTAKESILANKIMEVMADTEVMEAISHMVAEQVKEATKVKEDMAAKVVMAAMVVMAGMVALVGVTVVASIVLIGLKNQAQLYVAKTKPKKRSQINWQS